MAVFVFRLNRKIKSITTNLLHLVCKIFCRIWIFNKSVGIWLGTFLNWYIYTYASIEFDNELYIAEAAFGQKSLIDYTAKCNTFTVLYKVRLIVNNWYRNLQTSEINLAIYNWHLGTVKRHLHSVNHFSH